MVASAKNNDTPSRRLSSPRQLKGMDKIIIEESVSPPIVDNDWNDAEMTGNHHELRFLKKQKSLKGTKKNKDSDKESTGTGKKTKKGKKGKKKTSKTSVPDDDGINS